MIDAFDDRAVHFEHPGERLIHVHRDNIVANIKGQWTRPTILLAAQGQTPVFAHGMLLRGPSKVVQRPPGVHMVVGEATPVVALDEHGSPIALPLWARPSEPEPSVLHDLAAIEALVGVTGMAGARAALQRVRVRLLGLDCGGSRG